LTLKDYQLLAEFRHLLARFLAFSEEAAQGEGLAPRQHQALLAIKGYPGGTAVTVGTLAKRLRIQHNSAVELVDRLERMHMLTRHSDAADARRVMLVLTGKANAVLAALSTVHRNELRHLMPLLKPLLAELAK
jgi:DNA-binding MarR family transcriptional regulator